MSYNRRSAKKHGGSRKVALILIVISLVAVLAGAYFWSLTNSGSNGYQTFENHYLGIMNNLDSSKIKSEMKQEIGGEYNFTELFGWEHGRLTFDEDSAGWYEDPLTILDEGKGICMQFSIVYVAAFLALGQQARLVVATNTTTWTFIHAWAEVYSNGTWVHVDPSDQVWNQPSRYQSWDWGKYIWYGVKIYAFEVGKMVDVTSTYA